MINSCPGLFLEKFFTLRLVQSAQRRRRRLQEEEDPSGQTTNNGTTTATLSSLSPSSLSLPKPRGQGLPLRQIVEAFFLRESRERCCCCCVVRRSPQKIFPLSSGSFSLSKSKGELDSGREGAPRRPSPHTWTQYISCGAAAVGAAKIGRDDRGKGSAGNIEKRRARYAPIWSNNFPSLFSLQ